MMVEDFIVVSLNPDTRETSVDTYADKDKAQRMAERFRQDFPERVFYLGAKAERLFKKMEAESA